MVRGSIGKLVAGSLALARRWQKQQLRRLNVHEYQGAELMSKYGINVPKGVAASSIEEVKEAVKSVFPSGKEVVVKSQILAGGRGLGTFKSGLKGGVHIVKTEEVADIAGFTEVPVVVRLEGTNVDQGKRILKESGMTLITAEDLDDAAEKAVKAAAQ
ncbi:succinate--CoA ligase [ADP-forming] subunit beta, mitochondrial-like isoform X1 [Musa acuminata AAA Group]|uniref:succinate--CoA ligase [ADP-forming] subunit beta, mitochondrial-like isoform X1 n=1 Tax=Musa acuminata AAA Group TaxID=214697 RepID=UPI0031DA48C3